jgi:hypothetical protein
MTEKGYLMLRIFSELSPTIMTLIALFSVGDMTIFDCFTGGALGTDDHGYSASR